MNQNLTMYSVVMKIVDQEKDHEHQCVESLHEHTEPDLNTESQHENIKPNLNQDINESKNENTEPDLTTEPHNENIKSDLNLDMESEHGHGNTGHELNIGSHHENIKSNLNHDMESYHENKHLDLNIEQDDIKQDFNQDIESDHESIKTNLKIEPSDDSIKADLNIEPQYESIMEWNGSSEPDLNIEPSQDSIKPDLNIEPLYESTRPDLNQNIESQNRSEPELNIKPHYENTLIDESIGPHHDNITPNLIQNIGAEHENLEPDLKNIESENENNEAKFQPQGSINQDFESAYQSPNLHKHPFTESANQDLHLVESTPQIIEEEQSDVNQCNLTSKEPVNETANARCDDVTAYSNETLEQIETVNCSSHVHFASPLSVYHEYNISVCSSRTETQESENDDTFHTQKYEDSENVVIMDTKKVEEDDFVLTQKNCQENMVINEMGEIKVENSCFANNNINDNDCEDLMMECERVRDTVTNAIAVAEHEHEQIDPDRDEENNDINIDERPQTPYGTIGSINNSEEIEKLNENSSGEIQDISKNINTYEEMTGQHFERHVKSIETQRADEEVLEEVRDIIEELVVRCCCQIEDLVVKCEENIISESRKNEEKENNVELPIQQTHQVELIVDPVLESEDDVKSMMDQTPLQSTSSIHDFEQCVPDRAISDNVQMTESKTETKPDAGPSSLENKILLPNPIDIILTPENYSDKVKIIQENTRAKIHDIMSPQIFDEHDSENSCDENEIVNHNELLASEVSFSQGSKHNQSNLDFQIFDSEEENIESETEMSASNNEVETDEFIDNFKDAGKKLDINEDLKVQDLKSNNNQCSSDNPNTNEIKISQDNIPFEENHSDCHKKIDLNKTSICTNIYDDKTVENDDEERILIKPEMLTSENSSNNQSVGHLEAKHVNLPEIPYVTPIKKSFSDLIQNVSRDDTTGMSTNEDHIQLSVIDLKTNYLDANQESKSSVKNCRTDSNNLSNSRNHLQEFNLSNERNESETFEKQLVAENVHQNTDCNDAKIEVQQTTCINQESLVKEERLIKATLSSNNQQTNIANGKSERKRSIEKTNDEPLSKVLLIDNELSDKYSDDKLLDMENRDVNGELKNNYKQYQSNTKLVQQDLTNRHNRSEEMDQTVPVLEGFTDVNTEEQENNTETFYKGDSDIKKHVVQFEEANEELPLDLSVSEPEVHMSLKEEDCEEKINMQAFKWKYVPSIDLDMCVPDCDENEDARPAMPTTLKTCKKPYRLGLSKRQKLPSLHPKLKKIE